MKYLKLRNYISKLLLSNNSEKVSICLTKGVLEKFLIMIKRINWEMRPKN